MRKAAVDKDASSSERVAVIDADGRPLNRSVTRAEAHRQGVWHRSVSVFVLNASGEVLMERRSEFKDLFPGFYDIVGGHLKPAQDPATAAIEEIKEEIGLRVRKQRLEQLSAEDGVIEQVVLPDHGIVNRERKTIFLLLLATGDDEDEDQLDEEQRILQHSAKVQRLSPDELAALGAVGEVSRIEFWSWEKLLGLSRSSRQRVLASGTMSALADEGVRRAVKQRCLELRRECRRSFVKAYGLEASEDRDEPSLDRWLLDRFLERPEVVATPGEMSGLFEQGSKQVAGAYDLRTFRQSVAGHQDWDVKLKDPETRYVRNLIFAIRFGQNQQVQRKLEQIEWKTQGFVRSLLNLPMTDGTRFRDRLGNLADIAAARRATLEWITREVPELVTEEIRADPTGPVRRACLSAGRNLLDRYLPQELESGFPRFRGLVLLSLGASSADFNNPAFQNQLTEAEPTRRILRFLEDRVASEFARDLGGDRFLREFYEDFIASRKQVLIAYLSGNVAQAPIGLAMVRDILRHNPLATVHFIAKANSPGNDLALQDVRALFRDGEADFLADLAAYERQERLVLVDDGPRCHGLDPGRLSRDVARSLARATVVLAEGQAYAEIRGWRMPTYIAFRVNGRVAEGIHGVSRLRGACGFVRLTPGVDHFLGFESVVNREMTDPFNKKKIPAAKQTTSEYVQAILSENLQLLSERLFLGDVGEACQQLQAEAERLGETFASIVVGDASKPPDPAAIAQSTHRNHYPVFACGGGGGFSSVTLRALRTLQVPTAAGVPSTDDGGSTGILQRWLRGRRGFVFGVGDMAAILEDALPERGKRALLAYRFDHEPQHLTSAVMDRVVAEVRNPADPDSTLGAAPDFLSFVCNQLNLARVIDRSFRHPEDPDRMPLQGASIRNLNVIAAYELCGMLGEAAADAKKKGCAPYDLLKKSLRLPEDLLILPVTHSESVLYLEYGTEVSAELRERFEVPKKAMREHNRRVYGQRFIDILPQPGPRVGVGVTKSADDLSRPAPNPDYLAAIRDAELFIMGAGSLVSSQLSQLAVPGVVDLLLERSRMRKILVLNHVRMDETLGMSLKDHIRLVETVATQSASPGILERFARNGKHLRIAELFTDIVVPRTVASELEEEMVDRASWAREPHSEPPKYVTITCPDGQKVKVFRNAYTGFLADHQDIHRKLAVTSREVEILSYLDQPSSLYKRRSEAGRYRGALFATKEDIQYLTKQGIQRRNIHEVDSVGENWKFVKSEGEQSLEFFPGLVPEALVGIFRIALERSRSAL